MARGAPAPRKPYIVSPPNKGRPLLVANLPILATEVLELGLVALISAPVINTIFETSSSQKDTSDPTSDSTSPSRQATPTPTKIRPTSVIEPDHPHSIASGLQDKASITESIPETPRTTIIEPLETADDTFFTPSSSRGNETEYFSAFLPRSAPTPNRRVSNLSIVQSPLLGCLAPTPDELSPATSIPEEPQTPTTNANLSSPAALRPITIDPSEIGRIQSPPSPVFLGAPLPIPDLSVEPHTYVTHATSSGEPTESSNKEEQSIPSSNNEGNAIKEMGLLSAITGNISAPKSDNQLAREEAAERANTTTGAGTTHELNDTAAEDTPAVADLERTKSARSNYTSNTATTGLPPAPLVSSATGDRDQTELTSRRGSREILATGDEDHHEIVPTSTEHAVVGTEDEADKGLVDQTVHEPAHSTEYSNEAALGAGAVAAPVGAGLLASEDKGEAQDVPDYKGTEPYPASVKQTLNGDEPSRSYVKRDNGSILSGKTGKTARTTQTANPRTIDYATASPTALHEDAAVISLPAGGALHQDDKVPGYEGTTNGDAYPVDKKAPLTRQTTSASNRTSIAGGKSKSIMSKIEDKLRGGSASGKEEKSGSRPATLLNEKGTSTRPATLAEGREAPAQEDVYAQQNGDGSPHAAAYAAGGAAAGAGAFGLYHKENEARQRQSSQDPSFGQERAMSPEPGQSIYNGSGTRPSSTQRLAIAEPNQQQSQQGLPINGVNGPSPGPPIAPIAPGAYSSGANLGRGNTVRSTLSRGSTARRGGGGTFANGAALQGQGVAEAYARDDIHERTEIADRNLAQTKAGQYSARKISAGEAKDAKKLSRLIIREGKAEAKAVKASIEEIARLQKLQKKAASDELKAQKNAAKMAAYENRARMKFLKRKEAFERVEAEARVKQSDYEAKRQNASNQTDLLAEKTQELNDLRAQKAADDRERELKLLTLKNPGHA